MSLSDRVIFLWGHASDSALRAVHESLTKLNASVAFYDQRRVLETEFHLIVDHDVNGRLRVEDEELELNRISAGYIRPFDSRWLPQIQRVGPDTREWIHAVKIEGALIEWADITPAFIINRPRFIASNTSKPHQSARIHDLGFDVPDTLITTDPLALEEFHEKHGSLIYKSVSAARSVVARLTPDKMKELKNISWCPVQFQEYIPGIDYRVHVVGDEVFGCEIISEADDYRFAYAAEGDVELRSYELPADIAERCRNLSAGLGMSVAGIDLRRTPEGKWYCFEANPVAGFTYYQEPCNHHIDDAIAHLLISKATQ